MEDLIKSIKNKLSLDKDKQREQARAQEDLHKEEDVRSALEKVDTDHMVDAEEAARQMNEISTAAKLAATEATAEQKVKPATFNILAKHKQDMTAEEDDEGLLLQDDVSFLD